MIYLHHSFHDCLACLHCYLPVIAILCPLISQKNHLRVLDPIFIRTIVITFNKAKLQMNKDQFIHSCGIKFISFAIMNIGISAPISFKRSTHHRLWEKFVYLSYNTYILLKIIFFLLIKIKTHILIEICKIFTSVVTSANFGVSDP